MNPFNQSLLRGLGVAVLSIGLVACGSMGKTTEAPSTSKVTFSNTKISQRLEVNDRFVQPVGNFKKMHAVVTNTWHADVTFDYRVIWYDNQGIEIDPGSSAWQPAMLTPKSEKSIESVAPNQNAMDYKLNIKD